MPETNGLYSYQEAADRDINLSFFPPSEVTNGVMAWDSSIPLANDGKDTDGSTDLWDCSTRSNGLFCQDADFVVSYPDEGADYQSVRLSFPAEGSKFTGVIPSGYWSLEKNSSEIAVFDFGIVSPFKNNDETLLMVYVPDLKIETDSQNKVTRITVKWYLLESGTYNEITDMTVIQNSIKGFMISLIDESGDTQALDFLRRDGAVTEIEEFDRDWYFYGTESESDPVLDSVAISYYMVFGINYRFVWNSPI